MEFSRRDALKLGALTAGVATSASSATPKVGDLCSIEYRVRGNGPWNYFYEAPAADVTHARHIGYYVGETEHSHLTAYTFSRHVDGRVEPIHLQHWSKADESTIISVILPSR